MSANPGHDFADQLMARLDQVKQAERTVTFWWRDDDAIEPTPALQRLTDLSDHFGLPLALAVIPKQVKDTLPGAVSDVDGLAVFQHGWAHTNHQPPGEKKAELGDARRPNMVLSELARGFECLASLFADQFLPVLVPPWNRIAPEIAERRRDMGLAGITTFGRNKAATSQWVNTHVDIIDWRGSRGFAGLDQIRDQLLAEIDHRLQSGSEEPIGLLTHHLVHDEECWRFLETFLALAAHHPAAIWQPLPVIFKPRNN